jgi:hypothetical protein
MTNAAKGKEIIDRMSAAERACRDLWSKQGVPEHRQDEMIADITRKASAAYWRNAFRLAEIRGKKS